MTNDSTPETFNWVKARAECSVHSIFKALEQGVREDVKEVEAVLDPRSRVQFSVVASSRQFSVMRVDDPITAVGISVDFRQAQGEITVHSVTNDGEKELFRATLTLNHEGRCKLQVKDAELEQWQFRRMALEKLFFAAR
jgi:hypothetical protein